MYKLRNLSLKLFDDPQPGNSTPDPQPAPQPVNIDYDKLAQIIAGKQSVTEESVIKGYFKQQGLSKEEIDSAIEAYKAEKAKNDPQAKIKELQDKLDAQERKDVLVKKNVRPEDYDYVIFKAQQSVNDKTNFEKAVDNFLKENPRFINGQGSYRVSTGSGQGSKDGGQATNADINNIIRKGFGRN